MLLRKFNVSLIENIGEKGMREAWLTSKPTLTYKNEEELQGYLDGVIKNDLPLSGFNMFCLKIGSSLLFRDLLFTMRPLQVWALSSRITKLEKLGVESDYVVHQETIDNYEKVVKMQDNGESLDLSKRWCPLQQYTEYCVVIDLRTLLTFCKTVYYCDISLFNSHCIPTLVACNIKEELFFDSSCKSIYDKLSIPGVIQGNIDAKGGVYYREGMLNYELGVKVAQCLGAQFQRQHFAKMRTSLWNEVRAFGYANVLKKNAHDQFYYLSCGEISQWKTVVSRRVCWEAQFCVKDDGERCSWNFILQGFVKDLNIRDFASLLPCKCNGRKCTIFDEGKLRLLSNRSDWNKWSDNKPDENPICPIMCQTPEYSMKKRREMYKSEGTVWEKWKELVEQGYIEENPDNKARQFYEGKIDEMPTVNEL